VVGHTLQEWEGAVIIVSHDRYFLDNTVNIIWEMSQRGIESYSGNYSDYLLQRAARWEYYDRVFQEEKTRLLNEVDFIQRNWVRASTHARSIAAPFEPGYRYRTKLASGLRDGKMV
jgi:ATP-binding cassette subfamily F protein 3